VAALGGDDEGGAVRREGDVARGDALVEHGPVGADLHSLVLEIEKADDAVAADSGDFLAVGAEGAGGAAADLALLAVVEVEELVAGCRVPADEGGVALEGKPGVELARAGGRDHVSGRGEEAEEGVLLAGELRDLLAGGDVPELDVAVDGAGEEGLVVGE